MSSVGRSAALIAYRAGTDLAGKAAFFVVTVVAARRLSHESFGVFALGTTIGWIAAVATDFGIQLHLARAVAQHPGQAGPLLRRWLGLRVWTAVLACAAVAITLTVRRSVTPFSLAIFLFTVVYVVNGLIEFLHYFFRGLARSDLESTLTLGQRLATLVVALAVLWWRPDVTLLAAGLLLPSTVTLAYALRRAARLATAAPAEFQAAGPEPMSERRAGGLTSVLPIGAGIVLSALYFRIDVFLVDVWQGTAAVAVYNAVFRLVEALRLFPAAVVAVALPSLFRASTGRPMVTLSSIVVVAGAAISTVLWIAAGWLIPFLYGSTYRDAVPVFRILLLSFPLMSLNYVLTHQLIGWQGHRAYAGICLIALIFNVVVNVRLIPAIGIAGAAWTTLWTEVVLTAGCFAALGSYSMGSRGCQGARGSMAPRVSEPAPAANGGTWSVR